MFTSENISHLRSGPGLSLCGCMGVRAAGRSADDLWHAGPGAGERASRFLPRNRICQIL